MVITSWENEGKCTFEIVCQVFYVLPFLPAKSSPLICFQNASTTNVDATTCTTNLVYS